ncbi:MAG: hypothetical protein PHW18_11575 [Sulfuricurvum sp.]|uniref:hypothetical protein n=1 Tax=Sulfuricurvum sp. TaxID=2025608 RepID=UPI00260A1DEA|nr:hypothetical protein [Sulfuricurvum sp.]MDD2830203.1 hypothetical protein [Sulfuricurvum sp.]MDD4949569.1 hypothetical protein [Sulfuricurvum sp.]
MKQKLRQIAQNPKTKEALKSMKPEKSIWGFLGILFFFIVPEIIAFIYGTEITAYAKNALVLSPLWFEKYYFDFLVMMFKDGGSWLNLLIGVGLLIWLFF